MKAYATVRFFHVPAAVAAYWASDEKADSDAPRRRYEARSKYRPIMIPENITPGAAFGRLDEKLGDENYENVVVVLGKTGSDYDVIVYDGHAPYGRRYVFPDIKFDDEHLRPLTREEHDRRLAALRGAPPVP